MKPWPTAAEQAEAQRERLARRLAPQTWERLFELVTADVQRLHEQVLAVLARAEAAKGQPAESAVLYVVERELADLELQLTRGQMHLIHPDDRRYGAAQSLLRMLDDAGPRRYDNNAADALAVNDALAKAAA